MAKSNKVKHPARTASAQPAPRPRSVKVGFLEYVINWVVEDEWRASDYLSNDEIGNHNAPKATINIRLVPDVHEDYFRETLWHEIMHAVWSVCDLNDKPVPVEETAGGDDQEETIIARTSFAFAAVIKENPDVMAYLGAQLWKVKVRG